MNTPNKEQIARESARRLRTITENWIRKRIRGGSDCLGLENQFQNEVQAAIDKARPRLNSNHGEWTVRQWLNSDSWDIYCGDKRVIGDLLKDECEQIADAHNAALAAAYAKGKQDVLNDKTLP